MHRARLWLCSAAAASLLAALPAGAQLPVPGGNPLRTDTDRTKLGLKIKRKRVSGTVKAVDPDKKLFTLAAGKAPRTMEVPVDVGPSLILAGPGQATFADIRTGDPVTVWGEVTVQGGLRAMEITLPKERMSVPPTPKPKHVKGEYKVKPGDPNAPKPDEKKDEAASKDSEKKSSDKDSKKKDKKSKDSTDPKTDGAAPSGDSKGSGSL